MLDHDAMRKRFEDAIPPEGTPEVDVRKDAEYGLGPASEAERMHPLGVIEGTTPQFEARRAGGQCLALLFLRSFDANYRNRRGF